MDFHGISMLLEQLTWTGVAFGIVGYFFYREWTRREENKLQLERMTPEQLAELRRLEADIALERERRKTGNLWFLRAGMAILGSGCGLTAGLLCFSDELTLCLGQALQIAALKVFAFSVAGLGLFLFLEFLLELYLRREYRDEA